MIVNIQKAIELTGVSRSTIQRHIKQGKLSRTDKGIDTSELIRVYGALKNPSESVTVNQSDNSVSEREQWLIAQIDQLQKDLKELKVESIEREKRLMALWEHQAGADKSGGLFGRLFK
jgi:predicted site-specific integrase-resolvase